MLKMGDFRKLNVKWKILKILIETFFKVKCIDEKWEVWCFDDVTLRKSTMLKMWLF